jgi:hypothetical protein
VKPARVVLAIVALALAACCGGARAAPPAATPARPSPTATAPALWGPLRARVVARVADPALTEASGLALARGALWTHDDSGGPATLFALSTRAKPLGTYPIAGAENVDWEDIAARERTLYVGDIGDNAAARPEIVVYRVSDPGAPAVQIALRRSLWRATGARSTCCPRARGRRSGTI